jgi:hypothetical protein
MNLYIKHRTTHEIQNSVEINQNNLPKVKKIIEGIRKSLANYEYLCIEEYVTNIIRESMRDFKGINMDSDEKKSFLDKLFNITSIGRKRRT